MTLFSSTGAFVRRLTNTQAALLVAALAVGTSLHKYWLDAYNNYRIFAQSFHVLVAQDDLYALHPELYSDLFKYSPTFALAMAPFAWQPEVTGLLCWNLLNALSLFAALRALWPEGPRARMALAIVLIELVVSIQSSQSNALVAALIVLAFSALERGRPRSAGALIAAGLFLKVYGAAIGILAVLYRWRGRVAGWTAAALAVLGLAPLLVVPPSTLIGYYVSWSRVGGTFDVNRNASVMRLVERLSVPYVTPEAVQAAGALVFLLPFARVGAWRVARFRLDLLCSLLIGIVIFNISAEPPTFIVAVTGGAIWYVARERRSRVDHATLTVLLFTSFVSTDAYGLRGTLLGPFSLKAAGCLAVWIRINVALLTDAYASGDAVPERVASG